MEFSTFYGVESLRCIDLWRFKMVALAVGREYQGYNV